MSPVDARQSRRLVHPDRADCRRRAHNALARAARGAGGPLPLPSSAARHLPDAAARPAAHGGASWRSSGGTPGGVAIAVVPGQARGATTTAPANALLPWASAIAAVVLFGALARLVWIAAGILKLRRLRRVGAVAEASADHEDLQRVIAARATIRYVRELAQPVTFGFLAPVILLPSAVRDQPASIQRAVLAHELWHVRRRDWLWTLCEESLRAAVWFHPAIWSLLSRIQSAREEVVDELTVLTTGSRRTYVDALLAFADSSPSMAAPAFARRRHLVPSSRADLEGGCHVGETCGCKWGGAWRRCPVRQLVFRSGFPDAWGAAARRGRRVGGPWAARTAGEADHP